MPLASAAHSLVMMTPIFEFGRIMRAARTHVAFSCLQPTDVDFIQEPSTGEAGHAKRAVAQPVSNGTLISGSDRL